MPKKFLSLNNSNIKIAFVSTTNEVNCKTAVSFASEIIHQIRRNITKKKRWNDKTLMNCRVIRASEGTRKLAHLSHQLQTHCKLFRAHCEQLRNAITLK